MKRKLEDILTNDKKRKYAEISDKFHNLNIAVPDSLPCDICARRCIFYKKCGLFTYCSYDCYVLLLLQNNFADIKFDENKNI